MSRPTSFLVSMSPDRDVVTIRLESEKDDPTIPEWKHATIVLADRIAASVMTADRRGDPLVVHVDLLERVYEAL